MKVGEFAKKAGVNVETVRYYHREGLLPIPEIKGAYRYYSQQHVDTLAFISRAKSAGFTLENIKQLQSLNDMKDKITIRALSEKKLKELNDKIDKLLSAKDFLQELIQDCRNSDNDVCPILLTLKGK
ncbi:MerR family transcriptional regulator [Opacimonas viscosa]|uniref:MerR family transcriptional regulator n=1 Tax=Opacimonas viscosa TaxID=2961944 RepID=A0AA42BND1_9ALTE|nr:MerR family transcriptional regulator [Opacimonas viscosa]MCP3429547.1 MerR family transcriptional regulator [Opacimonas viscosa]